MAGAINKWQNAPLGLHFANISEKLTCLSCKMVLEPCVCVGRKSVQFLFHSVAYVERVDKSAYSLGIDGSVGAGEGFQGFVGLGIAFTT